MPQWWRNNCRVLFHILCYPVLNHNLCIIVILQKAHEVSGGIQDTKPLTFFKANCTQISNKCNLFYWANQTGTLNGSLGGAAIPLINPFCAQNVMIRVNCFTGVHKFKVIKCYMGRK